MNKQKRGPNNIGTPSHYMLYLIKGYDKELLQSRRRLRDEVELPLLDRVDEHTHVLLREGEPFAGGRVGDNGYVVLHLDADAVLTLAGLGNLELVDGQHDARVRDSRVLTVDNFNLLVIRLLAVHKNNLLREVFGKENIYREIPVDACNCSR